MLGGSSEGQATPSGPNLALTCCNDSSLALGLAKASGSVPLSQSAPSLAEGHPSILASTEHWKPGLWEDWVGKNRWLSMAW